MRGRDGRVEARLRPVGPEKTHYDKGFFECLYWGRGVIRKVREKQTDMRNLIEVKKQAGNKS